MAKTNPVTWFRRWREAARLRKGRIPEKQWRDVVAQLVIFQHLTQSKRHRLRELASLFLQLKAISGAGGLVVTDQMRHQIAAQACLLILELDLSYFDGWHEIILYPDPFVVRREVMDGAGLVSTDSQVLGGEAWDRGPVVLSWADARPGAHPHGACSNVVLHEFAHKLDMLNGSANGMPPLHQHMQRETWTQVFSQAYARLQYTLEHHGHSQIDPYAVTNPAEFFAVVSETFFTCPEHLVRFDAELYAQLQRFYQQDPLNQQY
ncbi:MAG: zinc-dependent peptidase [Gammaproteobacteria bacterium]|jgi:MtfA peptidase